jgi:hypothetical protein
MLASTRHAPPIECEVGEQPKVGGVLRGKRPRICMTEARIPASKDSVKITIQRLYADPLVPQIPP